MAGSKSMRSVTSNGTQIDQLKTLALVLADKLDDPNTDPRNIAALARQYRETINEINGIGATNDDTDEVEAIKRRQAARKS